MVNAKRTIGKDRKMRRLFEIQTMALTILRISFVLIVFTSCAVNAAT